MAFFSSSTSPFGQSNSFGGTINSTSSTLFGTSSGFGQSPFGGTMNSSSASSFGTSSGLGQSLFGGTTNSTTSYAFGTSYSTSSTFGQSLSGGTINSSSSSSLGTPSSFSGNYVSNFGFGNQCRGSALASYSETPEIDVNCGYSTLKIKSISAMPVYRDKSHEELRFEDYKRNVGGSSFPNQTPQTAVQQFAPAVFVSSSPFSFPPSSGSPFPSVTNSSSSPLFGVTSSSSRSGVLFNSFSNVDKASTSSGFGTSVFGVSNTSGVSFSFPPKTESGPGNTNSIFGVSSVTPFASSSGFSSPFGVPKTAVHSEPGHGSTNSLFVPFASTSGFSTPFGVPKTAVQSESGHGSTNSIFGVSNVPPFASTSSFFSSPFGVPKAAVQSESGHASTNSLFVPFAPASGFSSPFGVPKTTVQLESGHGSSSSISVSNVPHFASSSGFSSTVGFPSSFCSGASNLNAFPASRIPGFGITSSAPLWSTSVSVDRSLSGPGSTSAKAPPSTSKFNFSSSSTGNSNIFGVQTSSGSQQTMGIGPTNSNPHQGSIVAPYTAAREVIDGKDTGYCLTSISAMPIYKDKSHEELRFEDYEFRKTVGGHTSWSGSSANIFSVPRLSNQSTFITNNNTTSDSSSANIFSFPPLSNQSTFVTNNNTTFHSSSPNIFSFPPLSNQSTLVTNNNTTFDSSSPNIFSFPPLSNQSTANFSKPQAFVTTTSTSTTTNNNNTTIFTDSTPSPSLNPFSPPNLPVSPSQPSQEASSSSMLAPVVGNQNINAQQNLPSSTVGTQLKIVTNPLATRFAVDGHNAVTSTHGISSLPVSVKVPCSQTKIMTPRIRHVSPCPKSLPAQRHNSFKAKVPFFSDEVDRPGPSDPFLQRENPEAWISFRISHRSYSEGSESKGCSNPSFKISINLTEVNDDTSTQEEDPSQSATPNLHQDDAAVIEKRKAEVLALLPKLKDEDYYTEPSLKELEEKEMAEPGYCSRVNDFIVGRRGYGSVKFIGETDVRFLDIDSIIRFNNREVIAYLDDSKKPPVGQGLNKPAEISLLNVKCISKKTGKPYVDGPQVRSYEEMLMKKASQLGVEFISYDPVQGEWKFSAQHF